VIQVNQRFRAARRVSPPVSLAHYYSTMGRSYILRLMLTQKKFNWPRVARPARRGAQAHWEK